MKKASESQAVSVVVAVECPVAPRSHSAAVRTPQETMKRTTCLTLLQSLKARLRENAAACDKTNVLECLGMYNLLSLLGGVVSRLSARFDLSHRFELLVQVFWREVEQRDGMEWIDIGYRYDRSARDGGL